MPLGSVLVLQHCRQTIAVMRSLSRAGYRVILGASNARAPAEFSRHCHEVWRHPPFDDLPVFERALMSFLDSRPDIKTLFPVGEVSGKALCALSCLRARKINVAMVRASLFEACLDKVRANALAAESGSLIPVTQTAASVAEIASVSRGIGFPLIVKPVHPAKEILGRKAYILRTREELATAFGSWPDAHKSLIIQSYIDGDLQGCDFVARNGQLIGYIEAEGVRTDAADGTGLAVDFLSVPVTADLLAACRAFAATTDYSGPGLMQFIRAHRDGRLYFIENNPRLSAGIAHSIACGFDGPLLTLAATASDETQMQPIAEMENSYRVGLRGHWLEGDIEGWLRERGAMTLKQSARRVSLILRSFMRARSHMTWDWRDPLPGIRLGLGMLARLARATREF